MKNNGLYNTYIRQPNGGWNSGLEGAIINHPDYGNMLLYDNGGFIGAMGRDASGNSLNLDFNKLNGLQGTTLDGQAFQFGGNEPSGLANAMGYIGAGAGVLQGLGGLASAYTAYKGLQLAKDQFNYQKGLANRNLANQAKIINNSYDNAAQVAAGMIGGGSYNPATDSQGNYGMTDQAIIDKYAQKAKEKHVDGSPV